MLEICRSEKRTLPKSDSNFQKLINLGGKSKQAFKIYGKGARKHFSQKGEPKNDFSKRVFINGFC